MKRERKKRATHAAIIHLSDLYNFRLFYVMFMVAKKVHRIYTEEDKKEIKTCHYKKKSTKDEEKQ